MNKIINKYSNKVEKYIKGQIEMEDLPEELQEEITSNPEAFAEMVQAISFYKAVKSGAFFGK